MTLMMMIIQLQELLHMDFLCPFSAIRLTASPDHPIIWQTI